MEALITINPRLYPGSTSCHADDSGRASKLLICVPKNAIKKIPENKRRKKRGFEVFIVLSF